MALDDVRRGNMMRPDCPADGRAMERPGRRGTGRTRSATPMVGFRADLIRPLRDGRSGDFVRPRCAPPGFAASKRLCELGCRRKPWQDAAAVTTHSVPWDEGGAAP
ncbi:hypothetical protein [Nocardia amamiensis]|uniref:hypothetical protein n=1 Tax=Nocardia amamiensis TaxID=404578 RepID=UPI00082A351E|nr:hypothetical protein [Nocardia amamiensis]